MSETEHCEECGAKLTGVCITKLCDECLSAPPRRLFSERGVIEHRDFDALLKRFDSMKALAKTLQSRLAQVERERDEARAKAEEWDKANAFFGGGPERIAADLAALATYRALVDSELALMEAFKLGGTERVVEAYRVKAEALTAALEARRREHG